MGTIAYGVRSEFFFPLKFPGKDNFSRILNGGHLNIRGILILSIFHPLRFIIAYESDIAFHSHHSSRGLN